MKTISFYTCTILILSFVLSACHVVKKAAIDCPEFSQNRLIRRTTNKRNITRNIFSDGLNRKKYSEKSTIIQNGIYHKGSFLSKRPEALTLDPVPYFGIIGGLTKTDFLNKLVVSAENTIIFQHSPCDTIFLISGTWMNVKIDNISQDNILYRNCDSLSGPITSILKSDVTYIKYSNGVRQQVAKCDTIFLKSGGWRCVKIVKETQSKLMFRNYANLNGPVITVSKSDLSAIKYYVEEHSDAGEKYDSISANINDNKVENNNYLIARCDTIFLISGGWKCVKIVKETQSTIMFRKCDNPTGRIMTISKSELSAVKYFVDAHTDLGNNDTIPANTDNYSIQKTEPLATVGFISLMTSLIFIRAILGSHPILWLMLFLMGPILGAASLSNITKNPEKYKGKGLAKFSIIVGLLFTVVILFFLYLAFSLQ